MIRRIFGFIGICSVLLSCEFDQDEGFFVQTQAAYLLLADTLGTGVSIIRISNDNEVIENWEREVLGVSASDMDSYNNEFWVASAQDQALFKIDPEKSEIERRIPLADVQPHFISVGERYVLILDSAQYAIGFMDKRSNSLQKQAVPYQPGQALYQSSKFFLQGNEAQVHVLREEALTEINLLTLIHPIFELQREHEVAVMVYTQSDSLYEAAINLNSNAIQGIESPVSFQKKRFSPYQRQAFGKELLLDVELEAGQLNVGDVENIEDFEVDFFESKIYFLRSDSLFAYLLSDSLSYLAEDMSGQYLRKAYYYRDFVGE